MTDSRLIAMKYNKLRGVPTNTILGRTTAGTGAVEALTPAQVRTMIDAGTAASIWVSTTTTTIENTTTETTMCKVAAASDFEGDLTIGSMVKGDVFRFVIGGTYGADAVTPGTLTFRIKFDTDTILTFVADSNINTNGPRSWRIEGSITINDADASSTVRASGLLSYQDANEVGIGVPQANSVGSLDLSGTVEFDATAQWSVADTDNQLVVEQIILERLAPTASP